MAGLMHPQSDKKIIGGEPVFCRNRAVKGRRKVYGFGQFRHAHPRIEMSQPASNALTDFLTGCGFPVHKTKSTLFPGGVPVSSIANGKNGSAWDSSAG